MGFVNQAGLQRVLGNVKRKLDSKLDKSGGTLASPQALKYDCGYDETIQCTNIKEYQTLPFAQESWHDHLAFLNSHELVSHQVSADDGATWADITDDSENIKLKNIFAQKDWLTYNVLDSTEGVTARRFTLQSNCFSYSSINWYELGVNYDDDFKTFTFMVEGSNDGVTFDTKLHIESAVTINALTCFFRGVSPQGNVKYMRFTFKRADPSTTCIVPINSLKALSFRKGNQGLGKELEYPYQWDQYRRIYPYKDGGQSLGTPSRKWGTIYTNRLIANAIDGVDVLTNDEVDAIFDSVFT